MVDEKHCCRCTEPFYASYKGSYYCSVHLEEKLSEEKQKSIKISESRE
jgi:hypothetical protein